MKPIKDFPNLVVSPESSLREALNILNMLYGKIVYVVDDEGRLVGTITDGDIRRGLLARGSILYTAADVMFKTPATALLSTSKEERLALMRKKNIRQLPVIDDTGKLIGLVDLQDEGDKEVRSNAAVIMCGGMGKRLGKLTQHLPKPMLIVAGKPILEWIVTHLAKNGFSKIYLAINYLGKVIEKHFGDGTSFGVEIEYLRETKRMGTAGALGLLPEEPTESILVMNGDILTQFNIANLLDFHESNRHPATMGIVEYKYQNPYGVVRHEAGKLIRVDEKPVDLCFINAGIYALSPEVVAMIPKDEYFDMPSLFDVVRGHGRNVVVFPICEHWIDVGRESDYMKAQELQEGFFSPSNKETL